MPVKGFDVTDVSTYVDMILYEDRSPRYVFDLYERSGITKWTRIGRKLDEIVKIGGAMAAVATQIIKTMQDVRGLEVERLRMAPELERQKGGYDLFTSSDPEANKKRLDYMSKMDRTMKSQIKRKKLLVPALAAEGAATVLGTLGIFQTIGSAIDKSRFKRALKTSMHRLLMDAHPDHRPALYRLVASISQSDPFSNLKLFGDRLEDLMYTLRRFKDPRYEIHIQSIKKMLE